MFERFNEKTRRVIFFARYEAIQYGSREINTEHVLLGLAREDRALIARVLGPDASAETIRHEIEKHITKRERLSTSAEVPLSPEAKRILVLATEEADRPGDRYVEPRHILLAISRVKGCLAVRILTQMGADLSSLRQPPATEPVHERATVELPQLTTIRESIGVLTVDQAEEMIHMFVDTFRAGQWAACAAYLADHMRFVDAAGNRWAGVTELQGRFEQLFLPYAKQQASFLVESVNRGPGGYMILNIVWKGVENAREVNSPAQRMTVLLGQDRGKWLIFFIQVTPILGIE